MAEEKEKEFQYMVIVLDVKSGKIADIYGSNKSEHGERKAEEMPDGYTIGMSADTKLKSQRNGLSSN